MIWWAESPLFDLFKRLIIENHRSNLRSMKLFMLHKKTGENIIIFWESVIEGKQIRYYSIYVEVCCFKSAIPPMKWE